MSSVLKSVVHGIGFVLGGGIVFCGYELYTENNKFYSNLFMPFIHKTLDAENAHVAAVKLMSWNLLPASKYKDDTLLSQVLWKRKFHNPVGIAAGFDKDAQAMTALHNVGFGFVEVGSITPLPQEGNPKPRVFRLQEDNAVINRYGFNSCGHEVASNRLKAFHESRDRKNIILGVNLGKNKTSESVLNDFVSGVKSLGKFADYIVINVSSPNTPGLRKLQGKKQLEQLCSGVVSARNDLTSLPPLLIKIAPDLSSQDKKDIAAVILQQKVDGLIVCNTTVERPECLKSCCKTETGGLSGRPLCQKSTELIGEMYSLTNGTIPIIGVGGISNGQDAFDKIKAGASLVQLYTSMTYQGPPVVTRVKKELLELLKQNGFTNITDAVGADHRRS